MPDASSTLLAAAMRAALETVEQIGRDLDTARARTTDLFVVLRHLTLLPAGELVAVDTDPTPPHGTARPADVRCPAFYGDDRCDWIAGHSGVHGHDDLRWHGAPCATCDRPGHSVGEDF